MNRLRDSKGCRPSRGFPAELVSCGTAQKARSRRWPILPSLGGSEPGIGWIGVGGGESLLDSHERRTLSLLGGQLLQLRQGISRIVDILGSVGAGLHRHDGDGLLGDLDRLPEEQPDIVVRRVDPGEGLRCGLAGLAVARSVFLNRLGQLVLGNRIGPVVLDHYLGDRNGVVVLNLLGHVGFLLQRRE